VLILHRRAGKTTAILNHHQRAALNDDWEREQELYALGGQNAQNRLHTGGFSDTRPARP
jgi:hypothetical protein